MASALSYNTEYFAADEMVTDQSKKAVNRMFDVVES